jgi:hypothetical protein
MDPDGEVDALREMIVEAVESCTDGPLLDLIYKLLVCSA